MKNNWKHHKTIPEGEYCEIEGIDIWKYEWETNYDKIKVNHPKYFQEHILEKYWIDINDKRIEFLAGEFSMNIWGFYVPILKSNETKKTLNEKLKIARDITNEFDILNLILNGAPKNEYDTLTAQIISDITNKKEKQETLQNAFEILTESYRADTSAEMEADLKDELNYLIEKIRIKLNY